VASCWPATSNLGGYAERAAGGPRQENGTEACRASFTAYNSDDAQIANIAPQPGHALDVPADRRQERI
jgi:hypothetical protein